MTIQRTIILLCAALAALSVVSCEAPPAEHARRARAAFTELRDSAAGQKWAPELYSNAEEAVRTAERELTIQNARFSWTRNYTKAAVLFAHATDDAALATREAIAGRQAAEKSAREALRDAAAAIENTRAAMMVAPVARDGRSTFQRVDSDLDTAEIRLIEVQGLIASSDYLAASQRAREILAQVSSLLRTVIRTARK